MRNAGMRPIEGLPTIPAEEKRMHASKLVIAICSSIVALPAPVLGQRAGNTPSDDAPRVLVGRLNLERYKATIKGLTQFGDRQQGTDRNRAALDWIEAQLRSYGCTNTERIKYIYNLAGSQAQPQAQPNAATVPSTVIASGDIRPGL